MFDVTNDKDLSFLHMAIYDAPVKPLDLIKQANVDVDYENAPSDIFADPIEKKFPIHTAPDAAISALYIYKQASEVEPDVKENVRAALEEYGLHDLTTLLEGEKEFIKTASESDFLLPSKMKFPALDKDMLEKSASVIATNLHKMPLSDKVETATNLVKVAREMGYSDEEIPQWAFVYGQEAACNLHKVASALGVRHAITQNEGYSEIMGRVKELHKQAGDVSYDASLNRGICLEIFNLDKEAGVNYNEVEDPFQVVFNTIDKETGEIEKTASEEKVSIGGVDFYKDDLVDFFESQDGIRIIGDDLYKEASESSQTGEYSGEAVITVLQELPKEAQEMVAELLAGYVEV